MNGTIFCNKCGASSSGTAQFCSRCGATLNPAFPAPGVNTGPISDPATGAGYSPAAPTPYAQAGVSYGGFWIRMVAAIIDFIIVAVALSPLKIMFGLGGLALNGFDIHDLHGGLTIPFLFFGTGVFALLKLSANWLYEAFMESSSYQATLGKMIFGMKVTDLNGNRISFARATGRHFAKIISALLLCIGFIMVGFTARKQGLHDMIAETLVRRS